MYSFSGRLGSDALYTNIVIQLYKINIKITFQTTNLCHPLLDALPVQLTVAGVEKVTGVIVTQAHPTAAVIAG